MSAKSPRVPRKPQVEKLSQPAARALLTELAGRYRMLQRAGFQYGTKRDIYKVAGYVPQDEVKFAHYWGLYKRGDIAGRIVDMPAKTTWRTPPEIVEEDKPDGTDFTEALTALAKRLKLWRYLERVDRLAGVGRYAVLMIGVRGVDDTGLAAPLTRVGRAEDVIYLATYNEDRAPVEKWVTDPGDPRFGLPETYKLKLSDGVTGFPSAQVLVHASRVVHAAEDLLEDEVFGRPRLERPLNRLFDLDKIAASTGEAYWQAVVRILQAEIDPEADLPPAVKDELRDQMAEMVHDLRRQFIGQGAKLSWLSTDTPNPAQVTDMFFSLIAGACGIPKRILFGSELGELASSTDQQTYFGTINERQEQFAEPQILRPFIDRMIAFGVLPAPTTGEYQVIWPPLFEESETSVADANLKRAQTAAALTPVGGDPREIVEIDDDRNVWLVPAEPRPPMPLPVPGEEDLPEPGAGEEEEGGEGEEEDVLDRETDEEGAEEE